MSDTIIVVADENERCTETVDVLLDADVDLTLRCTKTLGHTASYWDSEIREFRAYPTDHIYAFSEDVPGSIWDGNEGVTIV